MSEPFNLIMLAAGFEHGGNVTHRHFDSHPQLFTYPFESMLGTPQSSNLLTPAVPFRYAWPSFDSEITAEQAYHSFYDEEVKTYLRTRFRSKFKDCGMEINEEARLDGFLTHLESTWIDRMLDREPSLRFRRADYIEALFRATHDAWTNWNRTGEETHHLGYLPAVHLDADKVFADFPTAKMVYVSRNPWSAYADTIKRPFPWSLQRYCQIHNVLQQHALICRAKWPNQFFTIRYEDLVASPTTTLNDLCDKLGLKGFSEPPAPSFNRVPLLGEQVYPWGTIKRATTDANIATAKELAHEQGVWIGRECSLMIREWGYLDFYDDNLW